MSSRILLVSGVLALAAIGTVIVLASAPEAAQTPRIAANTTPTRPVATPPSPAPATPDQPFVIKRILPIKGPIKYGEWHWDESGVPDGPLVITVDLDARVLSVFRNGYEIGATAVLLGDQDKPTPTGVFPITEKDIDHVSNIYTGAPMPYMQRLTNDGVSLHGSKVEKGYASHGCVGIPNPFAAKLFAITRLGDKVYITRGKQVGLGDDLVGS
ncbi:L,D-transpeptidase family protein [Novosphingobium profundi]|uniref:L,D-transpeptidase family protein n=1 Tax=Novosphingobium profundi TaxID=1774954 RepID=UPI001BD98BD1|nr:L,D-transpeptidase family protein [Novosphingobium profundi]